MILRRSHSAADGTLRRRSRGGAALELGLLMPVLVLMLCGVMDLARIFVAGIVVESAARAGVQYGSYSVGKAGASGGMNNAAQQDASGQGFTSLATSSRTFCGCNTSTSEVNCSTDSCDGKTPSGYVETTASYTFNPIVPYPGIPQNLVISSSARFRAQ